MRVLQPEGPGLRSFHASAASADEFCVLRIRSTCDVLVKMNGEPRDPSWKEAFQTRVETSIQEAEDLMLSLPYTQIRQQVYRLAPALDIVRDTNLVRAGSGDSSSGLIDVDLRNTIAREHHKYATTNESYTNRDVGVPPSPYNGSYGGISSQSRLESVKNELQATQRRVL